MQIKSKLIFILTSCAIISSSVFSQENMNPGADTKNTLSVENTKETQVSTQSESNVSSDKASDEASVSKKELEEKDAANKLAQDEKKREEKREEKREQNKRIYCKKFKDQLIAYYGEVYRVVNCKRFVVKSHELAKLTRKGTRVEEVKGEVVNAIPLASSKDIVKAKSRDCKEFEGSYITLDNDEVFLVEKCKKRKFPDWASFNSYRYKMGIKSVKLIEVSWEELNSIKEGRPFTSILDEENALSKDDSVDTIPIDEACKGIEGKFVSYYSRVYKIYKCHKRPVDPVMFTRKVKKAPKELSSEQWLSLPVGEPFSF